MFVYGVLEGVGSFKNKDGEYYKGDFKGGFYDGNGIYNSKRGNSYSG